MLVPESSDGRSGEGAHHPLDELTEEEISQAVKLAKDVVSKFEVEVRFNYVTLLEPKKIELRAFSKGGNPLARKAEVVLSMPSEGRNFKISIDLTSSAALSCEELPKTTQPLFTPDDCALAEKICKADEKLLSLLKSRFGVKDTSELVCDPWSIHGAKEGQEVDSRYIQCFLYWQRNEADNQYAHPLDVVPVVDMNKSAIVDMSYQPGAAPSMSRNTANYHRDGLKENTYLPRTFRSETALLNINQPEGPSFRVSGKVVEWEKWSLRVGFNYREGLVLYDIKYDGRSVIDRCSIVEMAVPYADPNPPFERKCAFDVGDYGLGYCANTLELGCDCLGAIHYYDTFLCNSAGVPYKVKNAICMHEEDDGVLWKHVEYRNGHSEARRSRRLVLSFIATVVNYEYLFYWYFKQDGTIEFEVKLSGMLSTNNLSKGERENGGWPEHGVLVIDGVNAQMHQHMFCARIDMAVDGNTNSVEEVDLLRQKRDECKNPFGNVFRVVSMPLTSEALGARVCCQERARTWKITNPSVLNPITKNPVSYKLIPFTSGASQPTLLTDEDCMVNKKGKFATKNLWVTAYEDSEKWPAGEFTVQGLLGKGLPEFIASNRNIAATDIVLWHCFGVTHVPRPEDFPVMPVEHTGFSLKPDGFFQGNPANDLPPPVKKCGST